jgi:hypothetical protein
MKEGKIIKDIQLWATRYGFRLFRNNVGTGWVGNVYKVPEGMLIKNPRPLKAGLSEGSSDLIGWREVTVSEEMVGKKLAVFVCCEVKTGRLKATEKQQAFIDAVNKAGGIGVVARSFKDLEDADVA